jgi:hypothetical protein
VYVSFDDGDHWQSLRINMPATSIRDLIIKDDDLVVATHGRGFWIMDDITSLRQNTDQQRSLLYKPANAYRVRWSTWPDTPLPQEEPAGENPPDGAIIDYYLKDNSKEVTLEIFDSNQKFVRRFSSTDTFYKIPDVDIPLYWIASQQMISVNAGAHRFVWDLHYTPMNVPPSYPISAVYGHTAPTPTSPLILPASYIAKLSVDGKVYEQSFTVKMDPRVKTSFKDLQQQHDLSMICYNSQLKIMKVLNELHDLQNKIKIKLTDAAGTNISMLNDLDKQLSALENAESNKQQNFSGVNNSFATLFEVLQQSDTPPTTQTVNAVKETNTRFIKLVAAWDRIKQLVNNIK